MHLLRALIFFINVHIFIKMIFKSLLFVIQIDFFDIQIKYKMQNVVKHTNKYNIINLILTFYSKHTFRF